MQADSARAIELCDQLRSVATELRNVLVQLGSAAPAIVLESVPLGKTLSRADASRKCGVSLATFDNLIRPHVPTVKVGTRRLFLESDLDTFLTREEATPAKHARGPARPGRRRVGATAIKDPKALAILGRLKTGGKSRG